MGAGGALTAAGSSRRQRGRFSSGSATRPAPASPGSPTESSQDPPSWPPTIKMSPGGSSAAGGVAADATGAAAGMCTGSGAGAGIPGPAAAGSAAAAAGAAAAGCCCCCCCGGGGGGTGCCCCCCCAAALTAAAALALAAPAPASGGVTGASTAAAASPASMAAAAGLTAASAAAACALNAWNSPRRASSSRPSVTQAARSPEFSFCSSDRACACVRMCGWVGGSVGGWLGVAGVRLSVGEGHAGRRAGRQGASSRRARHPRAPHPEGRQAGLHVVPQRLHRPPLSGKGGQQRVVCGRRGRAAGLPRAGAAAAAARAAGCRRRLAGQRREGVSARQGGGGGGWRLSCRVFRVCPRNVVEQRHHGALRARMQEDTVS